MKVALIIPARNEEKNIAKMVTMTLAIYDSYINQVIVVNDASSDNTAKIVAKIGKKDKRIKLINRKSPPGVGLALREGLRHVSSDCDYILTMDADFIRNIVDLQEFFEKIKDYDGLIGSRYLEKYSLVHYPFFKRFFNRMFHILVFLFLGIRNKDLTNNFKLYKKEIFDHIQLTANDFAINAETGLYPILLGYKIGELPVTWYARERDMGQSKFQLLKFAPSYIRVLLQAANISDKKSAKILNIFLPLLRQMDR